MSVHVLAAFLERSRAELGTRLVGIVLSDSAWSDGITWLPIEDIARRTRLSERQVYRSLNELELLGEIERRKVQRGRTRVNVYRLSLGASVPQYERLPFVMDDPFADDLTNGQSVRRPDTGVTDDLTPTSGDTFSIRKRTVSTSGEREPDELWEALIAELGDVTTKTERGERNAAHKELREVGATPEDVRARCRAYRRKWPEMALTASALKKHWSSLEGAKRAPRVEVPDRPEYSEEERLANLERVRGLTHSLGQEIA